MDTTKSKYEFFTSSSPLTQESLKDLVRLCGYAPTEKQLQTIPVPSSYSEFLELLTSCEKRCTREELYNQLVSLCGGPTITKEELIRILHAGDRLSDDEIEGFFKMITDERGVMSVKEIIETLYCED